MREQKGLKRAYFPLEMTFFLCNNMSKVLFPICTVTWRANNYFSRQGKGKNKRSESTNINI